MVMVYEISCVIVFSSYHLDFIPGDVMIEILYLLFMAVFFIGGLLVAASVENDLREKNK